MLIVNDRIAIPLTEFDFSFSRSGGPGGQNVNKVSSKVTLHWNAAASPSLPGPVRQRFLTLCGRRLTREGVCVLTSQRFRDQGRNVADCLDRLRLLLLEAATVPERRRPTRPTRGSVERRLRDKKLSSGRKQHRRKPPLEE